MSEGSQRGSVSASSGGRVGQMVGVRLPCRSASRRLGAVRNADRDVVEHADVAFLEQALCVRIVECVA